MADPEKRDELPASWRSTIRGNVLALGLVSLLTDLSSEMIAPLLPLFLAGLAPGSAALWVGLMEGIAETTSSLLKIVSGRMSDRSGRKKPLVVAGYGLSTLSRPLIAIAAVPAQVVALRFFDRIGKGTRTSPRDALIAGSVAAERRGLAFSFHRAMDHAGAVAGPLVAVAVLYALTGTMTWSGDDTVSAAEVSAMRWLFAFALLPGIAAMFTLVRGVRDSGSATGPALPWLSRPNLPRRFHRLVAILTIFALGNSSDLFLLLYGQTRFGFGASQVLLLWVAFHLAKIITSIPGGHLSDRYGRRPLILCGWAVYVGVYVGMVMVESATMFWILLIVYGTYYGLTEGVEKAMIADILPADSRGTGFGIYHAVTGLAALPASLIFGVIWVTVDRSNPGMGPVVAFSIGATLAAIAALLMIGYRHDPSPNAG